MIATPLNEPNAVEVLRARILTYLESVEGHECTLKEIGSALVPDGAPPIWHLRVKSALAPLVKRGRVRKRYEGKTPYYRWDPNSWNVGPAEARPHGDTPPVPLKNERDFGATAHGAEGVSPSWGAFIAAQLTRLEAAIENMSQRLYYVEMGMGPIHCKACREIVQAPDLPEPYRPSSVGIELTAGPPPQLACAAGKHVRDNQDRCHWCGTDLGPG